MSEIQEIHIQDGIDKGRIKDPNVAQRVADSIKSDMDDMLSKINNKIKSVEQEIETGLTPDQEENLKIMEQLSVKYPGAFNRVIDGKGREGLIINSHGWYRDSSNGEISPVNRVNDESVVILSQNGLSEVISPREVTNQNIGEYDLTDIMNVAPSKNLANIYINKKDGSKYSNVAVGVKNIRDDADFLSLIVLSAENPENKLKISQKKQNIVSDLIKK